MRIYEMVKNRWKESMQTRESIKHLWYWLGAMGVFLLCEIVINEADCYPVRIPLDDLLPFSQFFVIFYVLWYFLILGTIIWFFFRNSGGLKSFLGYMTVCQLSAVVIFLLWPTKQELRPEVILGDDIFSWAVRLIYRVDTNTNVCPSLHVCYSFALLSVWSKEGKCFSTKAMYAVLCALICLSTVMIKQHSVLDFIVALPVCAFAEIVTYADFWKEKFAKTEILRKKPN